MSAVLRPVTAAPPFYSRGINAEPKEEKGSKRKKYHYSGKQKTSRANFKSPSWFFEQALKLLIYQIIQIPQSQRPVIRSKTW